MVVLRRVRRGRGDRLPLTRGRRDSIRHRHGNKRAGGDPASGGRTVSRRSPAATPTACCCITSKAGIRSRRSTRRSPTTHGWPGCLVDYSWVNVDGSRRCPLPVRSKADRRKSCARCSMTTREVNIGANDHHANWFNCVHSRAQPSAHEEIGHRSASLGHLVTIALPAGPQPALGSGEGRVHRRRRGESPALARAARAVAGVTVVAKR